MMDYIAPIDKYNKALEEYIEYRTRMAISDCLSYFELIGCQVPTRYTKKIIEEIKHEVKRQKAVYKL